MRLRLAVSDLMTKLLKSRSLPDVRGARAVLNLVLVDVVLGGFEINCELGVVRECLILGIVLVQIEVIVVRYVTVGFYGGDVTGRSLLDSVAEFVFRVLKNTGRGAVTIRRAELLTQSLI